MFLKEFYILDEQQEAALIVGIVETIHRDYYPTQLFTPKKLSHITFEPITIFYGNNGSGKSTLLNLIARFFNAQMQSKHKKGGVFEQYLEALYRINKEDINTKEIKFISSDDIFDQMLDIRALNSSITRSKIDLKSEYFEYKNKDIRSWEDYDELRQMNEVRSKTMSSYVRSRLSNNNIIERSNGETSLLFWEQKIEENGLYFLDEPENSLSASNQMKLKNFIEESARFYNCQFIIASHSPFLLDLKDALIYDLDAYPCTTKKFNELENVKVYYDFFKEKNFE